MLNPHDVEIRPWQEKYLHNVKERFTDYVMSKGYSKDTAQRYISELCCEESSRYTLHEMGAVNFMVITGIETLERMLEENESSSSIRKNDLRTALKKYIEFLQSNPDLLSIDPELKAKKKVERFKAEMKQNVEDSNPRDSKTGSLGKGMNEEMFPLMCDVAMHHTIREAYNYFVKDYLRETGTRQLILNFGRDISYWTSYAKELAKDLLSDKYESLANQFMSFINDDDQILADRVARAIIDANLGEGGWYYWQMLARWKVAESVKKYGFEYNDLVDAWFVSNVPFREDEAMRSSVLYGTLNVYTQEEQKLYAEQLKRIFEESQKATQRPIPKNCIAVIDTSEFDPSKLRQKIKDLETKLNETTNAKDQALKERDIAISRLHDIEQSNANKKLLEHNELVAKIFCEIAQRYMECTKRKRTDQRTLIKNSLQDIMSQLKMFDRIPHDLQKCINNFDDENAPDVPQVTVMGDYILEQHVENQVGHVDAGATGITVNQRKK